MSEKTRPSSKARSTVFSVPLAALVAEANAWITATMGYGVPIDLVCQCLHTRDSLNPHLAMPMVQHKHHPQPRPAPLDREVSVYGEFLLLTYSSHDGYFVLSRHATLEEMAESICGGAGICNGYVDFQVAFYRGKCLPFQIRYTDFRGRRQYLDKRKPEKLPDDCDWDWIGNEYRDVEIEWERA